MPTKSHEIVTRPIFQALDYMSKIKLLEGQYWRNSLSQEAFDQWNDDFFPGQCADWTCDYLGTIQVQEVYLNYSKYTKSFAKILVNEKSMLGKQ